MNTYSVYVLVSLKNSKRYVGMTGQDPRERLKEHNSGASNFTKANRPWKLIYFELGYCKECAMNREIFLKSGQGRKLLDKIAE